MPSFTMVLSDGRVAGSSLSARGARGLTAARALGGGGGARRGSGGGSFSTCSISRASSAGGAEGGGAEGLRSGGGTRNGRMDAGPFGAGRGTIVRTPEGGASESRRGGGVSRRALSIEGEHARKLPRLRFSRGGNVPLMTNDNPVDRLNPSKFGDGGERDWWILGPSLSEPRKPLTQRRAGAASAAAAGPREPRQSVEHATRPSRAPVSALLSASSRTRRVRARGRRCVQAERRALDAAVRGEPDWG